MTIKQSGLQMFCIAERSGPLLSEENKFENSAQENTGTSQGRNKRGVKDITRGGAQ
jgi:hypothetical protein